MDGLDEVIPSKLPDITPDSVPPTAPSQLNIESEGPRSSVAAINRVIKGTRTMTDKRLKALERARFAKRVKQETTKIHAEHAINLENLNGQIVSLQMKLAAANTVQEASDIGRESLAATPKMGTGDLDVSAEGQTLSPIRRIGFSNLTATTISF